jgi:RimJ/RimL family protein N-acetyltransferase
MDGTLRTARLTLVPATLEELRVKFDGPEGPPPGVSPKWIEKLRAARGPDPWEFGYTVLLAESRQAIGGVSFKGPPGHDGVVEVAYGIDDPRVCIVCAHTAPGAAASSRVLEKCGFTRVADVLDPEDGLVWRFERARPR